MEYLSNSKIIIYNLLVDGVEFVFRWVESIRVVWLNVALVLLNALLIWWGKDVASKKVVILARYIGRMLDSIGLRDFVELEEFLYLFEAGDDWRLFCYKFDFLYSFIFVGDYIWTK
jgi:hypothetical protein